MRTLWVAVLGVGLAVSSGVAVRAETASGNTTHKMCRADKKAQKKTQKAEAKAARENAKAAREQVKAQEPRGGSQKMQSLAVVLTPPPM